QPLALPVERARIADFLLIDGNRSDDVVLFDHEMHKQKNGVEESCKICHHMRKPLDQYTPCADCHSDMQRVTDIFDHILHRNKLGGNGSCVKCHTDPLLPKLRQYTTACESCHGELRLETSFVNTSGSAVQNFAVGYKDAMHGLCITCHEEKKAEVERPRLDECATCHRSLPEEVMHMVEKLYGERTNNQ
ncbi:cytochrome c3 family protein, partial [candidate division KSB1 bacterium]